jgi:enoyl-CoA hydratase/carnithine racemase
VAASVSGLKSAPDDCVTLEHPCPHVALVTLNRPEARNAISHRVAITLAGIVAKTEADPEVRCVVLTGAGDHSFSAGADLKEVAAGGLHALSTPENGFAGFVAAARTKPWIAAVHGFALAGGFEVALACDMIVAADNTVFGLPEVTRGLIAAAGGVYRLPRRLPRALALELIATGQRLDVTRAATFGLVNRVVPRAETVASAIALATTIAANAPIAVRISLGIARQAYDLNDAALYRLSVEGQDRIMQTEDFQEGPRAFIEKRAPRWVGR